MVVEIKFVCHNVLENIFDINFNFLNKTFYTIFLIYFNNLAQYLICLT